MRTDDEFAIFGFGSLKQDVYGALGQRVLKLTQEAHVSLANLNEPNK